MEVSCGEVSRANRELLKDKIDKYVSEGGTGTWHCELCLGMNNKCRMNQPSILGKNWHWRLLEENLSDELQQEIVHMTKIYGRMNWN